MMQAQIQALYYNLSLKVLRQKMNLILGLIQENSIKFLGTEYLPYIYWVNSVMI